MNIKLLIPVVILTCVAAALLIFGMNESSIETYDIASLLKAEADENDDVKGIFQGYLFTYDEESNLASISNENPYTAQDADTVKIDINDDTRKPQLYIGAKIFVHGVFNKKKMTILAHKIEASCPSKEMDKLTQ